MKNEEMEMSAPTPEATESSKDEKQAKKSKKKTTDKAPEADQNTEINNLEQEVAELKDRNLRLYAEFENFRKRTARERIELSVTASADVISELLPVLDDMERALKNMRDTNAHQEHVQGIVLIQTKLLDSLKKKGLTAIESTVGKKFDVEEMEAITKIPTPSPDMMGKVVDEIATGYRLGDKVLRYAKVVVAEGESSAS